MNHLDNKPVTPMRINVLGMEQRALNTLQLFFHNLCHDNYILTTGTTADVSIIDMDAVHAEQTLKEHREKYPERPTVLISLLETDCDKKLFVKKPVHPEQLLSTLDRIREKLRDSCKKAVPHAEPMDSESPADDEHRLHLPPLPILDVAVSALQPETAAIAVEDKKEIPDNSPYSHSGKIIHLFPDSGQPVRTSHEESTETTGKKKEKAAFLFDPTNYLLGYIQTSYQFSQREKRSLSLRGPWRPIVLLPESQEIWVEQSHSHLYALSNMPIQAEDVTISSLDEGQIPPQQSGSLQPIDSFLWKLAVRTARGRIPVDTDLRAPVYLSHWPNLSRLMPIHHGLRIAALWAKQPVSLMETATILNIAPKYVFSFYSAASTLGLIEHGAKSGTDDEPVQASFQQQHEHRGLFRKILARLRGQHQ